MNQLIDSFGRIHRDLRISLTDKCNLRCSYCMPEFFNQWIPSKEHLTTEELVTVIDIAVESGITEVRLTGGEPLLRADIVDIVSQITGLQRPPAISMTTNGIALQRKAQQLVDAGLERINVSLDTLNRERFREITKRDNLDKVLEGLAEAKRVGLSPIKINAVLLRGINDDEAPSLLSWALSEGFKLRFIEQMPLDAGNAWDRTTFVSAVEIRESLEHHYSLQPVPNRGSAPAEEFLINGGTETVGIIASITSPFCGACDRLRLTSDGQLRSCLFATRETSVRDVLRNPDLDMAEKRARIADLIAESVATKEAGHQINSPTFIKPERPMSAIGG